MSEDISVQIERKIVVLEENLRVLKDKHGIVTHKIATKEERVGLPRLRNQEDVLTNRIDKVEAKLERLRNKLSKQ